MNNIYGAIATTVTILLLSYIYALRNNKSSQKNMAISQSMLHYRYSTVKNQPRRFSAKTQSKNHHDKSNIKVIIFENSAYWIKDNIFYKAPLVDHLINKDATEEVDTISMDKVQLDKMLFIMDKLRDGINDDSRGSRDE